MKDFFKNQINEYALKWIRTLIAAVRNDSHILESQYNSQRRTQADYKDRFFYELLQNARDVQGCSKIKIALQNNQLLFCNDGKPIGDRNFEGLCEPDRSSKKDNNEQTGKYGIGKSSYYDIAEANHKFFSKANVNSRSFDGYCFELASDRASVYSAVLKELNLQSEAPFGNNLIFTDGDSDYTIREILQRDPDGTKRIQELEYIRKNLPIPIEIIPENIKDLAKEFSTVICFTPDDWTKVKDKLSEFADNLPRIMLFLPTGIDEISVTVDDTTTVYYRNIDETTSFYNGKQACIGQKKDGESTEKRFFIWEKIATPEEAAIIYQDALENIKQRDPLKISIALNPDDEEDEGLYFCDLPTEMTTGMNIYIDANFQLQSDRRSIRFDDPYNEKLIDFCAKAIKEIVKDILAANNGVPCRQTALLIAELLQPWRNKAQDSHIYQALSKNIVVSELPCVWGIKEGTDIWVSPEDIVNTLNINWTEEITEREFYQRTGLPVLATEIAESFQGFIEFFTSHLPRMISPEIQQKVLCEFLIKNHQDHKKYLQTWQTIVDNWSDLLDENFSTAKIFLGKDGALYPANSVFKPEEKEQLLGTDMIAGLPYPFIEIETSFANFISKQNLSLNELFSSVSELNCNRCRELINHQKQSELSKTKEIIFKVIIQDFLELLSCQNDLLHMLLFPCSDNDWHPLGEIYQSKGWGSRANAAIEFLRLCGVSEEFICLRSPSNKIWEGISKEHIKELVTDKLRSASVFEEYQAEIFVEKKEISFCGVSTFAEKILSELIPSGKNSYAFKGTFFFFTRYLKELTEEHILLFWDIVCADREVIEDMISRRLYFEKISYHGKDYSVDNPLKNFLTTYAWIPGKNGEFYKPNEIVFLSKELRDKYPELMALEKIIHSAKLPETVRNLLLDLGASQINKESEISYDSVLHLLKDGKQLSRYRKHFWEQLAIGEYQAIELPSVLPVVESSGKHGYATLADTNIYIANLSKRDNNDLQKEYSPCLDIDLDLFEDKMYYGNKRHFILYSDLDREILVDDKKFDDCCGVRLVDYHNGLLAFALLLFFKNKKTALDKIRNLLLLSADSIIQKTGSINQEIPHYYQNNTIAARKNAWGWGIAEELQDLFSRINKSPIEYVLNNIDSMSISVITDIFNERLVDFDVDDVAEAKELLWGFGKAKTLALQFIPEVKQREEELSQYNSWEDVEAQSSLLDLELLKKFFNSTEPLVQRGKILVKEYNIDLSEWNAACEELDEGHYVNEQFDSEFNKLRNKKQDFFLTCLLRKTAWDVDNHFLHNALQDWGDFDASDCADKYWFIDDDAFENIINGFISQKYVAADQKNTVSTPYTIFQKNWDAWKSVGENADIDIYSNDYFLKEYPVEYFEIPPEEPEENIAEAEEDAATEETKFISVPAVSVTKSPSKPEVSAHEVSIDTESIRARIITSSPKKENHPTARSVPPISSERGTATVSTAASPKKDISEIVNWKNWQVEFTAHENVTIHNRDSNSPTTRPQRNSSPSDSIAEKENLSDEEKAYIGKHGEECLFDYLKTRFNNVKWVSTNNSLGIPGDDCLGYDFEIIDGSGKSQYVECKTTTGTTGTAEIHLGPTELSKAQDCLPTGNYSVYRVFPHGEKLQIVDLGNPLAKGNSVISFCGLEFRWRKG